MRRRTGTGARFLREAVDGSPKDPKIAVLQLIQMEKKHAIFDVFDWHRVLGCL